MDDVTRSFHPSSNPGGQLIGTTIMGQYKIVRFLGEGGMGQIYLAEQLFLDRLAAIKILPVHFAPTDETHQRFRREARAMSMLHHPNIVAVYNFGELASGELFLAMEYVAGSCLCNTLSMGPLPCVQAIEVTRQCVSGLDYAHRLRVIHRDLKPSNVILDDSTGDTRIKLLDFGIARIGDQNDLTRAGTLIGTPRYMSPEQCRGEPATHLSDQYSLGLVFYECLTGKPAFDADSPLGYIHMHQKIDPILPSKLLENPSLGPLDEIVMRMLAKAPGERFTNMNDVGEALGRIALDSNSQARGAVEAPQEKTDGDSRVPSDNTSHTPRPREEPRARVLLLGQGDSIKADSWKVLEAKGLVRTCHCLEPSRFASCKGLWDVILFVLPHAGREQEHCWRNWIAAGVPSEQTLVCIDSPLESPALGDLDRSLQNVFISAPPFDGDALSVALHLLNQQEKVRPDVLLSSTAVPVLQITTSRDKDAYVQAMLDDISAEGIRRPALRALKEICDEMIMNAIFNAPVEQDGRLRHAHLDRASDITLLEGDAATLRWAVGQKFIAVSVRDNFGSIQPAQILSRVTGPPPKPRLNGDSGGSGMGLRIMSRASRHLFFAICPESWCEVIALVDREPSGSPPARSLTILSGLGAVQKSIGNKLRYFEQRRRDLFLIRLEGEVNESADLSAVFSHSGQVVLDLAGVTGINSVGIRKWLEAFRDRPPDQRMVFERCSPPIVSQINMVPAFAETGQIRSILAGYFCETCSDERLEILQTSTLQRGRAPARRCPKCSGELNFEDLPEEYFAFVEG
jgi:serine/threonine protein kinase